jgi:DNA-binding transcriptional LysR family regulator
MPEFFIPPKEGAANWSGGSSCACEPRVGVRTLSDTDLIEPSIGKEPCLGSADRPCGGLSIPSPTLASIQGLVEPHVLHQHVQPVLDASTLAAAKDWGVFQSNLRLPDLGAKKTMLLAGLGWGNMPAHMVEDEIEEGRLTVIQPARSDTLTPLALGLPTSRSTASDRLHGGC